MRVVRAFAFQGYAALNSDFDSFYTRRLKLRIDDCFSHPVTGVPGRTIMLLDRYSDDYNKTMVPTGTRALPEPARDAEMSDDRQCVAARTYRSSCGVSPYDTPR